MLTNIKTIIKNYKTKREAQLKTLSDAKLIDKNLICLENPLLYDMKAVLKNQLTYTNDYIKNRIIKCKCGEQVSPPPFLSLEESLSLTKNIMLEIDKMRPLIGIQSMSGPVGLVYTLGFKDIVEHESGEKKMTLEILANPVESITRKLQTSLSIEAIADMRATHGIDITREAIRMVGKEIGYEIINEVLSDLKRISGKCEIVKDVTSFQFKLNSILNSVAFETRRGAANIIIVGSEGKKWITESPPFEKTEFELNGTSPTDFINIGTFNKIDVYSCEALADDEILVTYKGKNGETDCGYILTPYLMHGFIGPVVDALSFQSKMGFITRYGKLAAQKTKESHVDASNYYKLIKLVD